MEREEWQNSLKKRTRETRTFGWGQSEEGKERNGFLYFNKKI